jgi:transposase-like protein
LRLFVEAQSDGPTCLRVVESTVPAGAAVIYTDEWSGYARVQEQLQVAHASVRHGRDDAGRREWARDDDGDGVREVHCNSCEGAGTGLRTYLRVFRGVHKQYLHLYVATYEAMTNAKRITAQLIERMCRPRASAQTGYT